MLVLAVYSIELLSQIIIVVLQLLQPSLLLDAIFTVLRASEGGSYSLVGRPAVCVYFIGTAFSAVVVEQVFQHVRWRPISKVD
jgi:hypothetical protein